MAPCLADNLLSSSRRAGVRPGGGGGGSGHSDGRGHLLPAEPLQSIHPVLHPPPGSGPEAGGQTQLVSVGWELGQGLRLGLGAQAQDGTGLSSLYPQRNAQSGCDGQRCILCPRLHREAAAQWGAVKVPAAGAQGAKRVVWASGLLLPVSGAEVSPVSCVPGSQSLGKSGTAGLLPPDPQEQCRCLQTHRDRDLQVSPEEASPGFPSPSTSPSCHVSSPRPRAGQVRPRAWIFF